MGAAGEKKESIDFQIRQSVLDGLCLGWMGGRGEKKSNLAEGSTWPCDECSKRQKTLSKVLGETILGLAGSLSGVYAGGTGPRDSGLERRAHTKSGKKLDGCGNNFGRERETGTRVK